MPGALQHRRDDPGIEPMRREDRDPSVSSRRRYRVWPAGLLALVGFLGAGAVATQAAPASSPPACVPDGSVRQLTMSGYGSGAQSGRDRPTANGTSPTQPTSVCADLDPALLPTTPSSPPANPDV